MKNKPNEEIKHTNKRCRLFYCCDKLIKECRATISTPSDTLGQAKLAELFALRCNVARTNFIAVLFVTISDLILNDRMTEFGNVVINTNENASATTKNNLDSLRICFYLYLFV